MYANASIPMENPRNIEAEKRWQRLVKKEEKVNSEIPIREGTACQTKERNGSVVVCRRCVVVTVAWRK